SANATTATAPAISTNFANDAVVMVAATQNDATFSSFTTTSPGALNQTFANLNKGWGGAWAIKSGTGTTGNGTATISASKSWAAILVSLKPAGCSCNPTIGTPTNNTVECPASPSFTAPTASDSCGGGTTVQTVGTDTTTQGTCSNNYTVTRSYRAVDDCGNTSGTVTQTSTVRDTTPPAIGR